MLAGCWSFGAGLEFARPCAVQLQGDAKLRVSRMQRNGDRIGEYELVSPLGAGGFGSVWLAHAASPEGDPKRAVAIKILHRDMLEMPARDRGPTVVDRFLAEARIIARLDHPGLVQIYDLIDDREHGVVAYVMEKLEGCDLTKIDDNLDLETLLDIFAEVADTLTFLHAEGVIHRDVTPRNIFVTDPEPGLARPCRVKLLDFGTAKELYATHRLQQTGTGVLLGALRSMAPESFLPKATPTPAIDQWGLGVAIYVCLTGHAPFDNMSLSELVRRIEKEAPPPMVLLPRFAGAEALPELEAIVLRLLAKDPAERFVSVQDAAIALRAVSQAVGDARERTLFDPQQSKTEPTATPSSMNLSPSLKLAHAMVSRRRIVALPTVAERLEMHTLPEGAEETIPAPPPVRIAHETDEKGWATMAPAHDVPDAQPTLRGDESPTGPNMLVDARVDANVDPIDGVTARLNAPPKAIAGGYRAAPRRKPTTAPQGFAATQIAATQIATPQPAASQLAAPQVATTQLSLQEPDLRPTLDSTEALMPPPPIAQAAATPRALSTPKIALASPPSTAAASSSLLPKSAQPARSTLRTPLIILLMIAATAIGWFIRDFVG